MFFYVIQCQDIPLIVPKKEFLCPSLGKAVVKKHKSSSKTLKIYAATQKFLCLKIQLEKWKDK